MAEFSAMTQNSAINHVESTAKSGCCFHGFVSGCAIDYEQLASNGLAT
jgi:hypothetical protein